MTIDTELLIIGIILCVGLFLMYFLASNYKRLEKKRRKAFIVACVLSLAGVVMAIFAIYNPALPFNMPGWLFITIIISICIALGSYAYLSVKED